MQNQIKYTVTHQLKENVEVLDVWNHQVIKPGDKLVFLPYFKEKGQILLKYKDIPEFQLKYPSIDKWLTVAKKDIQNSTIETLKSGLKECFGITLDDKYEPEILTPIFLSDDTCAEYYICIVPLMEDEYTLENAEDTIQIVSLTYTDLNNYIVYDLITRHCLNVFRQTYSLF